MSQVRSSHMLSPVRLLSGFIILGLALVMVLENPFYTYKRFVLRLYRLCRRTYRNWSVRLAPLESRIGRHAGNACRLLGMRLRYEFQGKLSQAAQFGNLFSAEGFNRPALLPEVRHALSRIME